MEHSVWFLQQLGSCRSSVARRRLAQLPCICCVVTSCCGFLCMPLCVCMLLFVCVVFFNLCCRNHECVCVCVYSCVYLQSAQRTNGVGGGRIRLQCPNSTLTLNGVVSADGQPANSESTGGAGSGGTVILSAAAVSGSGFISAVGGAGLQVHSWMHAFSAWFCFA